MENDPEIPEGKFDTLFHLRSTRYVADVFVSKWVNVANFTGRETLTPKMRVVKRIHDSIRAVTTASTEDCFQY